MRPRWGAWILVLLSVGLLALVAIGTLAVYELRYADRIYPGIAVAGIQLDGLTLDEAAEAIRDGLTPYPGAAIELHYGDRMWSLAPTDLGVAVDERTTAAAAYAIGRRGLAASSSSSLRSLWNGLQADLLAQWDLLRNPMAVVPAFRFDENHLALTLKRIAQEVDLPPREGRLTISGLEVSGMPGQPGREVDLQATRAAVAQLASAGQGGTVQLVVEERLPAVLSVDAAVAQANALLGRALSLRVDGLDGPQRFAVDPPTLSGWLTFTPVPTPEGDIELAATLDQQQVAAFVRRIAEQVDRPVFDALLDFDTQAKQVVVLQPSQAGQQLDAEGSRAAIQAAILQDTVRPQASAAAAPITATYEITLPVALLQPKVDSTRIAEMGIVEEVSQGTTYFAGSTRERIQNIVTAVNRFRGAVIPPGEQFSFYRFVGDVSAANGFVDSLIIVGDRTEVGVGGGVCQVSTTMFRAAFQGGFPILERYPHSYVVSWYGAPGYDASIFTPTADFRFLNDTGHYLLIQPDIDTRKGRITFHFYGTRPDRAVESTAATSNEQAAPKPLYREDSSLPAGVIKLWDSARKGMDVTVTRTIRYGDGRVKQDRFVSKYRPWPAVYRYGPGTELPPEATAP